MTLRKAYGDRDLMLADPHLAQFWDGRQPFGTTTHAIYMPNAYVGANDTELIL